MMKEIENIEKEEMIVTDEVTENTEKVRKKEKKAMPKNKTKKVDILAYVKNEKFIIVRFDDKRNLRIDNIEENPGKQITIEYEGVAGTPTFKFAVKK